MCRQQSRFRPWVQARRQRKRERERENNNRSKAQHHEDKTVTSDRGDEKCDLRKLREGSVTRPKGLTTHTTTQRCASQGKLVLQHSSAMIQSSYRRIMKEFYGVLA